MTDTKAADPFDESDDDDDAVDPLAPIPYGHNYIHEDPLEKLMASSDLSEE